MTITLPNMQEIVYGEHVCLYCGKKIEGHWEDYHEYFACNCKKAKTRRGLLAEIRALQASIPPQVYYIELKREVVKKT